MTPSIGARHVGTLDQAAPFMPFQISGSSDIPGVPFGWNLETGEPFCLDLFLLQRKKRLNAIIVMILGQIRMGKTTLAKVLAKRHEPLDFGPQRCRIGLSDTRINANVQEYKLFTEYFGEEMISLHDYRLNPLDPAMGTARNEQRSMLRDLLEYRSTGLSTLPSFVMRLALDILLDRDDKPSLETFGEVVSTINLDAAARRIPYLRDDVQGMRKDLVDIYPEAGTAVIDQQIARRRAELHPGLTEADIHQAAMEVFFRVDNLLDGELGDVFGGDHSISDLLQRRVVGRDYSRLDEDSIPLVESMFWNWSSSALKRRDPRFRVNIEIHDENYASWEQLEYAVAMYNHIKKIRQHGGAIIMNSHRLNDYYSVGAAGSRQRALASNMVRDVQAVFLARQDPEAIPEIRSRWPKVTAGLGQVLTGLPRGCFCAIIGDEDPALFRLELTPTERLICESDQAGDSLTGDYYEEAV